MPVTVPVAVYTYASPNWMLAFLLASGSLFQAKPARYVVRVPAGQRQTCLRRPSLGRQLITQTCNTVCLFVDASCRVLRGSVSSFVPIGRGPVPPLTVEKRTRAIRRRHMKQAKRVWVSGRASPLPNGRPIGPSPRAALPSHFHQGVYAAGMADRPGQGLECKSQSHSNHLLHI